MKNTFSIVLTGTLVLVSLGALCIPPTPLSTDQTVQNNSPETSSAPTWNFDETKWRAVGEVPDCPEPLQIESPTDISQATSILYPGQTRGGNYKPHGGFRFDGLENDQVSVLAPFDAYVVDGARYLAEGEFQYTFDFIAPCGLMYRIGHLYTLTPEFQALAEQFTPAQEGQSQTQFIEPPVLVTAGTTIATAVGVTANTNTFFDFGVYDLRQKNAASKNSTWAAEHTDDNILAPYAICWFDLLPTPDAKQVWSLPPGDPTSGTNSDYCQK
ncbi:MAG: hypothetical protein AAB558_04295 [Patescibacteria group bacterium]